MKNAAIGILILSSICLFANYYDVVIYSATSAGVIAAVQAAKMGKSVALIEPGKHVGGMTASGLGFADIGDERSLGGLAQEFFHRVWLHYQLEPSWRWESK